jgi:expansin (peptidoglycan-binding protein)
MARLSLFAIVALTISGLVSAAPVQEVDLSNKELAKRSSYSGTATFFHPATEGGSTGACGPEEDNNSAIVALNAPQYGDLSSKSDWCGKTITIKGPAGTATARINDACPECGHGSLDLTPSLFKKVVGEESIGEGDITWSLS